MWIVNVYNLEMTEEDYGIELPISVTGIEFGEGDTLRFTFKKSVNGETLLVKEFTNNEIVDNVVNLVFTDAESALFPVGSYVYSLDWYQLGVMMCNIIKSASLQVVEKA